MYTRSFVAMLLWMTKCIKLGSHHFTEHQQTSTLTSKAMCQPPNRLPRPPCRSVKKNRVFPVKNEKLFERSEFFSFREMQRFFSSGAAAGAFSFCFFFFCAYKRKKKSPCRIAEKHINLNLLTVKADKSFSFT